MARSVELVYVVLLELHVVVSEFLNFWPALCRRFPFVFPIGQNVSSWKKKKWKLKMSPIAKKDKKKRLLPVFTDESESKKSSFLSWLILDVEFCWLEVVLMCEWFWCCWNSKLGASLSNQADTLSNLSNLDDSSISTFFTINFVVRLLVSIFDRSFSSSLTECAVKVLSLSLSKCFEIIFPEILRFKRRENKYTKKMLLIHWETSAVWRRK